MIGMTTKNHVDTSHGAVARNRNAAARTPPHAVFFTGILLFCLAVSAQGVRRVEPAPRPRAPVQGTKILTPGAVVSDVLAVNPFAFEGLDASDITAVRVGGIERYCERSDGLDCLLEAPVKLPTGAVVTRLELDAIDNGPLNPKANFYRCPIGASACTLLAEISTIGTPGAAQEGVDLAQPETIDNQSFTYLLEVFPGNDGLTRLLGVRLLLAGAESSALSEVLALHAYAFEGGTPGDRAALRADGVQRSCTGASCSLAAAVALPSGASVTRIELDAIDNDGAADVAAGFSRCDAATGACTGVAAVSTAGTPGADQPGFDLVSPEIIDNGSFTYRVNVTLGATNETRLVGLRLFFDRPPALPKNDRLASQPLRIRGPRCAPTARCWMRWRTRRFCNGQACTMLAPVELPSGTRVDRLELSAWDSTAPPRRFAPPSCGVRRAPGTASKSWRRQHRTASWASTSHRPRPSTTRVSPTPSKSKAAPTPPPPCAGSAW